MKVYDYSREQYHCREGIATDERGVLLDTFWGYGYSDRHRLSATEVESARFRFDTDDFEDITPGHHRGCPQAWSDRAPADRQTITSQHGLQVRWFIRKDSLPDYETRLENARRKVSDAESGLRLAESRLNTAEHELEAIEAEATS